MVKYYSLVSGLAVILAMVLVSISSCEGDDVVYSCDREANSWAIDNIDSIRTLDWNGWKKLPAKRKHAAYNAFSAKQKADFWLERLSEIKSMDWTDQELAHIDKVVDFIENNLDLFGKEELSDEENDRLDLFFYQWVKKAELDLGWSRDIAMAIVGSAAPLAQTLNEEGRFDINTQLEVWKEDGNSCHCNVSHDFCPSGWDCVSGNCGSAVHGCGWILVQSCNGRCNGI